MNELKRTAADIDSLSVFPFLNSELIASLKHELPDYLAEAEGVSKQGGALQWWKSHEENLCNWSNACKLVLPSSVAVERVFSILASTFSAAHE